VRSGADINPPCDLLSPLHWAAFNDKAACCTALVQLGAKVNARSSPAEYTPLHLAAAGNAVVTIFRLISVGADIYARSKDLMTAEMLAVDIGQEDAAGVLKFIRRRMEQGRWRSSLDHKRSVEEAGLGTSWYNGTLAPKLSAPQLLKRHATEERVLNFKETSNGSEALAPPTSSLAAGTPGTPGVERSGGPDQDLSRGVAVPGKIVIRNLPPNTREWDVREEFHKRDLPEPLNIDVILNKEYNTRTGSRPNLPCHLCTKFERVGHPLTLYFVPSRGNPCRGSRLPEVAFWRLPKAFGAPKSCTALKRQS